MAADKAKMTWKARGIYSNVQHLIITAPHHHQDDEHSAAEAETDVTRRNLSS